MTPHLGRARAGRNSRRCWQGKLVASALVLALPCGASMAKREQALRYWERATAERQKIEALPDAEQSAAAYQKLAEAFRRVYTTSPQSSKADDSLFEAAAIYSAMCRRFGADPYKEKAAEAYRLLLREYPHSPFSAKARKLLEQPETAASEAPREKTERALVTDVRHWSLSGLTRVVVGIEAETTVHSERLTNPDRVFFDLPNTRLSPALKGRTFPVGDELVKQIRIAQTQIGVTRVVLDLKSDAEHTISMLTNPARVVVEVKPRTTEARTPEPGPVAGPALAAKIEPPKPVALPKAAQTTSRGERNLIRALGLKVGRVVIDAGHGGHDTGTIGPSGLMEKDLVLDVATRLGALITDRIGSEVIFTRADDTFIPLEERTALANEKQADLFLSIHANSSRLATARGIETYYLNLTADREALDVAARENAAAQRSIHDLQDLVSKITLTEKIAESREFATQVQRSLYRAISRENAALRNRGVRKAPFVVLIGARMPSVLAEISFLSNPRDEKLLKTSSYRQKIAEALFHGVATYSKTLSRVEVASK